MYHGTIREEGKRRVPVSPIALMANKNSYHYQINNNSRNSVMKVMCVETTSSSSESGEVTCSSLGFHAFAFFFFSSFFLGYLTALIVCNCYCTRIYVTEYSRCAPSRLSSVSPFSLSPLSLSVSYAHKASLLQE